MVTLHLIQVFRSPSLEWLHFWHTFRGSESAGGIGTGCFTVDTSVVGATDGMSSGTSALSVWLFSSINCASISLFVSLIASSLDLVPNMAKGNKTQTTVMTMQNRMKTTPVVPVAISPMLLLLVTND
jgi:hypothetical protein